MKNIKLGFAITVLASMVSSAAFAADGKDPLSIVTSAPKAQVTKDKEDTSWPNIDLTQNDVAPAADYGSIGIGFGQTDMFSTMLSHTDSAGSGDMIRTEEYDSTLDTKTLFYRKDAQKGFLEVSYSKLDGNIDVNRTEKNATRCTAPCSTTGVSGSSTEIKAGAKITEFLLPSLTGDVFVTAGFSNADIDFDPYTKGDYDYTGSMSSDEIQLGLLWVDNFNSNTSYQIGASLLKGSVEVNSGSTNEIFGGFTVTEKGRQSYDTSGTLISLAIVHSPTPNLTIRGEVEKRSMSCSGATTYYGNSLATGNSSSSVDAGCGAKDSTTFRISVEYNFSSLIASK
jgi:hypothetical protein